MKKNLSIIVALLLTGALLQYLSAPAEVDAGPATGTRWQSECSDHPVMTCEELQLYWDLVEDHTATGSDFSEGEIPGLALDLSVSPTGQRSIGYTTESQGAFSRLCVGEASGVTPCTALDEGDGYFELDVDIVGDLGLTGDLDINSNFTVDSATGNTVIVGTLGLTGNLAIATSKFTVDASNGDTDVLGDFAVNGSRFTVAAVTGDTVILGDLTLNTDKFTVDASNGDTAVLGDFAVNGSKFTVNETTGNVAAAGTVDMTGGFGTDGAIFLKMERFTGTLDGTSPDTLTSSATANVRMFICNFQDISLTNTYHSSYGNASGDFWFAITQTDATTFRVDYDTSAAYVSGDPYVCTSFYE